MGKKKLMGMDKVWVKKKLMGMNIKTFLHVSYPTYWQSYYLCIYWLVVEQIIKMQNPLN
jgi:hypothetical protein